MHFGLERNLSFADALMIGLGTMLGAGIFVLTGIAAQEAGPAAVYSYLLAGGTVLLTALSFAELSTAYPRAGGPYAFVLQAFSPKLAFLTGWSLWVGLALTTTFYAIGFAQYLSYLFPIPWTVGASLLAAFVIYVNIIGSKYFSRVQNTVVALLLVILSLYLVLGWSGIDPSLHEPFFPYGWPPVIRMASVLFVSFLGFELIATAAEEIKNPAVNVPLATVSSVIVVTVIYAVMVFVTTGIQAFHDLGNSPTPIADTAAMLMGPAGGWLLVGAGLLATVSSANGSIMAASRISFAMSRDGLMPALLGQVHPKSKTPVFSMVSTGVIVFIAILKGEIEWLAEAAGFLHLYPFVLVNLAAIQLRGNRNYRPGFKLPLGPVIPLLGAISSGLLIMQIHLEDMVIGSLLVIPGVIYYSFSRLRTNWRTS